MQRRGLVAREGDQADVWMVMAQPSCRCYAVEQGHVKVDHDRVGVEVVCKLDRLQPVGSRPDYGQLGLPVDQVAQRFEKGAVVVRDQYADSPVGGIPERFRH